VRILGWILILAAAPALLGAAEIAARLFDLGSGSGRRAEVPAWLDRNILVKEARWMELLGEAPGDLRNYYRAYAWDRRLFYRFRPNLRISLTDVMAPPGVRARTRWTLTTNSKGFAGPAVPYGPHPGIFRVVCMGDSSTFGWGVEAGDAYPAVLEQELRRRHPDLRIEVVNLGVCGYSSFQGRILMDQEAKGYLPDVVTLSYGSNDWSRVPEPFDAAYRRNAGWTGAVRSILHHSRAYEAYAGALSGWLRKGEEGPVDPSRMPLNVGPEKALENQVAMIEEVRSWSAVPLLVTNCVPGQMAEPLREAARRTGAPLLDSAALLRSSIPALASGALLPELRARAAGIYGADLLAQHPDLEVYLADGCHPNAAGQHILARALADEIDPLLGRSAPARRSPGS